MNIDLLANVTAAATSLYMTRSHYIRYVLAKELDIQDRRQPAITEKNKLEELFKPYLGEQD